MRTLISCLFVLTSILSAPAQDIVWSHVFGADAEEIITSSCSDSLGNLYAMGRFSSKSVTFGNYDLSPLGATGIFIVKIDTNGNVVWAKRAGGNSSDPVDNGGGILYDPFTDRIFVNSVMSGNGQSIDTCAMSGMGTYLTCMSRDGECLWTTDHQGCYMSMREADGHGAIYYMVVAENPWASFNGTALAVGRHLFKVSAIDGSTIWHRYLFSTQEAYLADIDAFEDKVYIYGYATATDWNFDTTQVTNNFEDIFVARMDSAGTLIRIDTYGGLGSDRTGRAEPTADGGLLISGKFTGTLSLGNGLSLIDEDGSGDIFYAKMQSNGTAEWAYQIPSANSVFINGLTLLPAGGSLLVVGHSAILINGDTVTPSTGYGTSVFELDEDGSFLSSIGFAHNGSGQMRVEAAADGQVYLFGTFFDTTTLTTVPFTSAGSSDVFVARIDYTTGIGARLDGSGQLYIYANPTTGLCNITVPEEFINEPGLTLRVTDMNGRAVSEQYINMRQPRINLDLRALATGVYNASLSNGRKVYNGRIMFQ